MKLEDAIKELSFLECKVSILNELLSVLSDINSNSYEIVFRIPENMRDKSVKEIADVIDKKRIEILTEIEKLKKIEVSFGRKNSSKGKTTNNRSKRSAK